MYQPGVSRWCSSEAGRVNSPRVARSATKRIASATDSVIAIAFSSDSTTATPTEITAAHQAPSSRCARPRAMKISPRPSTLSMKCAPSRIGSGNSVERMSSRASAAGVTPEKISAAPMASVSAEARAATAGAGAQYRARPAPRPPPA